MNCPKHNEEMGSIPITKYDNGKRFGTNYFCKDMNCNYEVDKNEPNKTNSR